MRTCRGDRPPARRRAISRRPSATCNARRSPDRAPPPPAARRHSLPLIAARRHAAGDLESRDRRRAHARRCFWSRRFVSARGERRRRTLASAAASRFQLQDRVRATIADDFAVRLDEVKGSSSLTADLDGDDSLIEALKLSLEASYGVQPDEDCERANCAACAAALRFFSQAADCARSRRVCLQHRPSRVASFAPRGPIAANLNSTARLLSTFFAFKLLFSAVE